MARTRYFKFEFSDGHLKFLSSSEHKSYVESYCQTKGVKLLYHGISKYIHSTKKTKKDGFRSGHNEALGMNIRGERHFNQVLKEKGLRVAEGDKPFASKKEPTIMLDESDIRELKEDGAELSDNECDALISNTYVH